MDENRTRAHLGWGEEPPVMPNCFPPVAGLLCSPGTRFYRFQFMGSAWEKSRTAGRKGRAILLTG